MQRLDLTKNNLLGFEKKRKWKVNFKELYKTSQWRKIRAIKIQKNPLCEICFKKGNQSISKNVDHIIDHKGNIKLFLDYKNLQALCVSCHRKKSARERFKKIKKER